MEFDLDSSSSQVTPKQLAALRSWIDTFPFMNEEQGFTDRPSWTDLSRIIYWLICEAVARKRRKVSDQLEEILLMGSELPKL